MVKYYYPKSNSSIELILINRVELGIKEHPKASIRQIQHYTRYHNYALSLKKIKSIKQKINIETARRQIKQYYTVIGQLIIIDANSIEDYRNYVYLRGSRVGQLYKDEIRYATTSIHKAKNKFNNIERKWNRQINFYADMETIEVEGQLSIDIYNKGNTLNSSELQTVRFR